MSASRVDCATHGDSEGTVVCVHVVDTLRDRVARGFLWHRDEDDEFQAVCDSCADMSDEDWERQQVALGRVLCLGCFKNAAKLNGVDIPEL